MARRSTHAMLAVVFATALLFPSRSSRGDDAGLKNDVQNTIQEMRDELRELRRDVKILRALLETQIAKERSPDAQTERRNAATVVTSTIAIEPSDGLYFFSSRLCSVCQTMRPIIGRMQAEALPIIEVTAADDPGLADRFHVTSYPTFVLIVRGNEKERATGAQNEEKLRTMLANIPNQITRTVRPNTIENRARHQIWAMPLTEALHLAFANNKIVRSDGAGTEFARIATPLGSEVSGVGSVSQGTAIARINEDMALSDFEMAVFKLFRNTEDTYWNLYLQYRLYHATVMAHNSAVRSWREASAKKRVGGAAGDSATDEPQMRDQIFNTRAASEQALSNLYIAETNLRRLLGLPLNDGKLIRPSDEPLTAKSTCPSRKVHPGH